jgi:putative ubiquitin-RnfH superfamily antitoxin RatB of RatAB toxin-antitoxin module
MRVEVAYAAPGIEARVDVEVGPDACLRDAVERSGLLAGLDPGVVSFALHGQRAGPDTPLREGDRVEILRPLQVDPGTSRRARAQASVRRKVRLPR